MQLSALGPIGEYPASWRMGDQCPSGVPCPPVLAGHQRREDARGLGRRLQLVPRFVAESLTGSRLGINDDVPDEAVHTLAQVLDLGRPAAGVRRRRHPRRLST